MNLFKNWTRTSPDILGTVYIYMDCSAPINKIRNDFYEYLKKHPLWNQKAWGIQVTNMKDYLIEVRALVSADNASKAWDLRCDVREWFVKYLSELENGKYLPNLRLKQLK